MPSIDVSVVGTRKLLAVGQALRDSGDRTLKKELLKAAQRATRPVKLEMKAAAARDLPKSGGLNTWVAGKMRVTTRTRTLGRNVGVRIILRRPNPNDRGGYADLGAINRGRVRHPTYGHRPWVVDVHGPPAAFWAYRTMQGPIAHRARREFVNVLDVIIHQIRRAA